MWSSLYQPGSSGGSSLFEPLYGGFEVDPHPGVETTRENDHYVRVLFYSYYFLLYHYYWDGGPPKIGSVQAVPFPKAKGSQRVRL